MIKTHFESVDPKFIEPYMAFKILPDGADTAPKTAALSDRHKPT